MHCTIAHGTGIWRWLFGCSSFVAVADQSERSLHSITDCSGNSILYEVEYSTLIYYYTIPCSAPEHLHGEWGVTCKAGPIPPFQIPIYSQACTLLYALQTHKTVHVHKNHTKNYKLLFS